jgi:hypothetical protein
VKQNRLNNIEAKVAYMDAYIILFNIIYKDREDGIQNYGILYIIAVVINFSQSRAPLPV